MDSYDLFKQQISQKLATFKQERTESIIEPLAIIADESALNEKVRQKVNLVLSGTSFVSYLAAAAVVFSSEPAAGAAMVVPLIASIGHAGVAVFNSGAKTLKQRMEDLASADRRLREQLFQDITQVLQAEKGIIKQPEMGVAEYAELAAGFILPGCRSTIFAGGLVGKSIGGLDITEKLFGRLFVGTTLLEGSKTIKRANFTMLSSRQSKS
ncbi:unnamed protein product, partial [Mesorhabditis spiculigera]